MTNTHVSGLGEPETSGKRSLFQPPVSEQSGIPEKPKQPERGRPITKTKKKPKKSPPIRVHLTTDITVEALMIIQSIQHEYRMEHGKVLPQWKAFSQAVEYYGKTRSKERAA
jgi:hypothetical protein